MSTITIREQLTADDPSVVDLWNRIDPEYPPLTLELYRGEHVVIARHARLMRWVALVAGRLAGALSLQEVTWLQTPDVYFVELGVSAAYRQHGLGRRLAAVMDDAATRAAARVLYVRVREGDERAERFATAQGFAPTGDVDRMSRLHVARANLDSLSTTRERLRAHGIRIARLAELHPDDAFLRVLHAVMDETATDIPSAEPFGGNSFEAWSSRYIERSGMSPEWIWVALAEDRPVGAAFLRRYTDEAAGHSYTGVARAYRGRGIARALKLEQIQWAREHGISALFTGNDARNIPMLAVNTALGYEFLPAQIEWGKALNDSSNCKRQETLC